MREDINIKSRDYWFKVVEMLQQNWALIDKKETGAFVVYFIDDASGVFDEITFESLDDAESGLRRNGFARFADDKHAQSFLAAPEAPFKKSLHPNGMIYSSGRFWR